MSPVSLKCVWDKRFLSREDAIITRFSAIRKPAKLEDVESYSEKLDQMKSTLKTYFHYLIFERCFDWQNFCIENASNLKKNLFSDLNTKTKLPAEDGIVSDVKKTDGLNKGSEFWK